MINLFVVKIFLFIFVLTIVWGCFIKVWMRGHKEEAASWVVTSNYPWWYLLWGFMILIDLVGVIYSAIYFIFVAW